MKIMGIGSLIIEIAAWGLFIGSKKLLNDDFQCIRSNYLIPTTAKASVVMTCDDILSYLFIGLIWYCYY